MKSVIFTLLAITCLTGTQLLALDVYLHTGAVSNHNLSSLQSEQQESFETVRHKDGKEIKDNWQGISLQKWLNKHDYTDFQSIRLESHDNYMVRVHKADLDSMPGYIALVKDNQLLDSLEVRVIFPQQRDMFWVRGIVSIYLEDFKPVPPPRQIYIWDAEKAALTYHQELPIFKALSGYSFNNVMETIFHQEAGSVIVVSRDGLKTRLEYPKHLKDAVLATDLEGTINLKSPIVPAGMWLKDVVYMQCGPYALIKQDYLYRLHTLYSLLNWSGINPSEQIIRAKVSKQVHKLEAYSLPDFVPFNQGDWIELP